MENDNEEEFEKRFEESASYFDDYCEEQGITEEEKGEMIEYACSIFEIIPKIAKIITFGQLPHLN